VKALLLHQHFNLPDTGGALRSYFLAKALADAGIETVVITAHAGPYQKKVFEGVEVHYLSIAYKNSFGFYPRVWSFLRYVVQSVYISATIRNINVCYAMSTPLTVGLAGVFIKWMRQVPLVFETGDLWPDAPIELGIVKNPILKFLLRLTERFIYSQSNTLVALSQPMKATLQKRTRTTVHLIPNMADTEFFKPALKRNDLQEKFGSTGKFVVSYIGSVGYANGLDNFLDCARAVQKANLPALFLMCGEGAMLAHLQTIVQQLSIDNVRFIGFQNREGVREVLNVTDAVFVSYRHHLVLQTGSPNKYFDGLAAGKMMVTNFGGWIKEEIENARCGFSTGVHDPEHFARLLSRYIADPTAVATAQQQALALSKKYERKLLSDAFVQLIRQTH
jgi:glycosyltransferase involved in cell wall biosynthesis